MMKGVAKTFDNICLFWELLLLVAVDADRQSGATHKSDHDNWVFAAGNSCKVSMSMQQAAHTCYLVLVAVVYRDRLINGPSKQGVVTLFSLIHKAFVTCLSRVKKMNGCLCLEKWTPKLKNALNHPAVWGRFIFSFSYPVFSLFRTQLLHTSN